MIPEMLPGYNFVFRSTWYIQVRVEVPDIVNDFLIPSELTILMPDPEQQSLSQELKICSLMKQILQVQYSL